MAHLDLLKRVQQFSKSKIQWACSATTKNGSFPLRFWDSKQQNVGVYPNTHVDLTSKFGDLTMSI